MLFIVSDWKLWKDKRKNKETQTHFLLPIFIHRIDSHIFTTFVYAHTAHIKGSYTKLQNSTSL